MNRIASMAPHWSSFEFYAFWIRSDRQLIWLRRAAHHVQPIVCRKRDVKHAIGCWHLNCRRHFACRISTQIISVKIETFDGRNLFHWNANLSMFRWILIRSNRFACVPNESMNLMYIDWSICVFAFSSGAHSLWYNESEICWIYENFGGFVPIGESSLYLLMNS